MSRVVKIEPTEIATQMHRTDAVVRPVDAPLQPAEVVLGLVGAARLIGHVLTNRMVNDIVRHHVSTDADVRWSAAGAALGPLTIDPWLLHPRDNYHEYRLVA